MALTKLTPASSPGAEQGAIIVETERLIIRRYYPSDAEAMAKAANNPLISKNMRNRFPSPYSLADAENFINNIALNFNGSSNECGLFLKPNTAENPSSEPLYIGAMGMMPKDDIYIRNWELGYWIAEPAWGKGYATEAVKAFVRWSFETWPELNRIEAVANGANKGSQNVLRKAGFLEEGTRRGAIFKNGEIFDEVQFGLLRSEMMTNGE
ncbi:putative N-acetyltransferase p20 [Fusarium austroafricanum]|uniref:Putative N-acetyltransferase p20 n=1 Tax=Fusarium austroafricanum TaxID=2364996 RepID=A0A8H4KQI0_9HYPO|nr:putative N-acetyltransferase p20 [Fusarium austroafricanum]